MRFPATRGATLIEMMLFGAIASTVLIAVVGLLSRGTKLVELVRRTSGAQTDLRAVVEQLAEDAGELVQFDGGGGVVDVASTLTFKVLSSRAEKGVPSGHATLRTITYKLDGPDKLKDVVRTVDGGTPETLVKAGVATFKVWPIAAVPKGKGYVLKPGDAPDAHQAGATPACFVIEISAGAEAGEARVKLEQDTVSTIVTKLWCRNRVLELSRGALK